MVKPYVGNEKAYELLCGNVFRKNPHSIVLCGEHGLGKSLAARWIASQWIKCKEEELAKHPDFYEINKGENSITVEDIMQLIDKSGISACGSVKVFLIQNAGQITQLAQNKLLKLLEDGNQTNKFLFTFHKGYLLDTVKSRCCQIFF